ncbi:MAG: HlyD family efflux transporter periplasmic adaptor subunit [Proteobacteria bacterium]|nr:HlyD family efflux transporter periplasmic adaptor subunit [Pseudomonadota bacterium]
MRIAARRARDALAPLLLLCGFVAHARTPAPSAASAAAGSEAPTITVRAQPVAQTLRAYGEVRPVAVMRMSAVEAGVVQRLVLPGERVKGGQVLAVLGGPQAHSLLAQRQSALRAASIQLAADRHKLAAQLATRQTLAADEAAYAAARGQLQVAVQTLTLRAPARGQVLAVHAADGEQVAAGQLILTLQTRRPWLSATYYGAQALSLHPGMTGRFQPVSGGAIPVRVKTVSRALGPGGGEQVGLLPVLHGRRESAALAPSWRSGQWGTVTLVGPTRPLFAVPTRALILDRARWWVLVRTPRGDRRQQVVPGPTRGWMTYVSRGLKPGEQVVVENAFLEFHRGISQRYTPPN